MLPLSSLHTCANSRIGADDVGQQIIVSHLNEQSQCMLPLLTLFTSADSRTVADVAIKKSLWATQASGLRDNPKRRRGVAGRPQGGALGSTKGSQRAGL